MITLEAFQTRLSSSRLDILSATEAEYIIGGTSCGPKTKKPKKSKKSKKSRKSSCYCCC